ncbi:MAG: hypothetical protein H6835_03160 [Planctomycetes bacterium]|nr:hypothetical protein [Planctomycetota bacterium]
MPSRPWPTNPPPLPSPNAPPPATCRPCSSCWCGACRSSRHSCACRSARSCAPRSRSATSCSLDQLPEDYREAILLRRVVGLEYAEIAAPMERSDGATRNLVHRGLARLSALLTP